MVFYCYLTILSLTDFYDVFSFKNMRDVIAKHRVGQIALQRLRDEKATVEVELAALKVAYKKLEEDIRGLYFILLKNSFL